MSSPLDPIDASLALLRRALLTGDAPATLAASTQLRQQLSALAEAAAPAGSGTSPVVAALSAGDRQRIHARLSQAATELHLQRENLVRRSVPVDRAVKAVFGEPQDATYSAGMARRFQSV